MQRFTCFNRRSVYQSFCELCLTKRYRSSNSGKSLKQDPLANLPKKIFSGIQPTGSIHLGNYLGAIHKWLQLQKSNQHITCCIVDMHSITLPQNPPVLRENIFEMAAAILACGINPQQSTIFVQSAVGEHMELCWILGCATTMARLGHLPQYKEKVRNIREVPLGLYVYPVLQAADIMLHKATHVPVGEDQIQHIQLTQQLIKSFNAKYGQTFPMCHAIIDDEISSRIRSLRNPMKKMSKSDPDPKATVNINDEPDVIVEKVKKALTDFTSDVSYDPDARPGVSNLVAIHSLVSGQPIDKIVDDAKTIDTGRYKIRVAEAIVEHFKPVRSKMSYYLNRKNDLVHILEMGANRAREQAEQTMAEVKQKMGLGTYMNVPKLVLDNISKPEITEETPIMAIQTQRIKLPEIKPYIPQQKLRVEKARAFNKTFRLAPAFDTSASLQTVPQKPRKTKGTDNKVIFCGPPRKELSNDKKDKKDDNLTKKTIEQEKPPQVTENSEKDMKADPKQQDNALIVLAEKA